MRQNIFIIDQEEERTRGDVVSRCVRGVGIGILIMAGSISIRLTISAMSCDV